MKFINVNYDDAHRIVESNKNLIWDGWNIIEYKYDTEAIYSPNARRINGKWASIKIYKPYKNGWSVPNRYAIR